jgi:hypothetical protein
MDLTVVVCGVRSEHSHTKLIGEISMVVKCMINWQWIPHHHPYRVGLELTLDAMV